MVLLVIGAKLIRFAIIQCVGNPSTYVEYLIIVINRMGNILASSSKFKMNVIYDKKDAQNCLNDAEKKDFYLEECYDNTSNLFARKNLTYSANNISYDEKPNINEYIKLSYSFLPSRLLNDLGEITIVSLMPTADGGMPHTRPNNIICYPNILQLFSSTTLIHELWHIHQRQYNSAWAKTFKNLGWEQWEESLPDYIENMRRYNPDTIDCPYWIFNKQWIPIPIFKDISHPKVNDVEIWFYNPYDNYHIKRIPMELLERFPNMPNSAYEHPRELTAYLLAEPDKYRNSIGFKQLIDSIGIISVSQNFKQTRS